MEGPDDETARGLSHQPPSATRRKGLLIVGNFLSSAGGTRSVAEELAGQLKARNWPVLTVSSKRNRVVRLLDMMWSAWHWRHRYDAAQVDVFSGPAFLWAEAVCHILRFARRPYILTLHGGRLGEFADANQGRVARLLRSADAVTAPSLFLRKRLSRFRGDVILLPNALDLRIYRYRNRRPAGPRLVWLRAFHQIYRPEIAVGVLAGIRPRFPGASLTMIGPDKQDGTLQRVVAMVSELGLNEAVRIVAGVPKADVPVWLDGGDIFLNTSDIDNTPVSVLEAMACGLCVVTTDAGGLPDLVSDGHDALVVPRADVSAMTAAVERILANPDLAGSLSANATTTAAPCDWPRVLGQWEALIERVSR